MEGVGGEAARHPFVHDDDARAGADLPAARIINPIHRILVHKEKGVTELLNAGLQAIGGGHGPVATAGLSAHEKDSLPSLSANDEAGFDYIRKHQNGGRSPLTFGGGSGAGPRNAQSGAPIAGQILRRGSHRRYR